MKDDPLNVSKTMVKAGIIGTAFGRLTKLGRKAIAGAMVAVQATLMVALCSGCMHPLSTARAETPAVTDPYPYQPDAWFFRISGEVSFEGQDIVYDDIIEIRAQARRASDLGQIRGNNHSFFSRRWIVRSLSNGEGLMMEVPDAAGLWADLNGSKEKYPEAYIQDHLRPPAEFLPEFSWIDNINNPMVIEGYVSASYYEQSNAKLKIIHPIKLDYVSRSEAAHTEAIEQMMAEPHLDLTHGLNVGGEAWMTIYLLPIEHEFWKQQPAIKNLLDLAGDAPVVAIPREQAKALLDAAWKSHRSHWIDATQGRFGIPQPKKYPYPQSEGTLYGRYTGFYGDQTVPLACQQAKRICKPDFDQHGYYRYMFGFSTSGTLTVVLDNRPVAVSAGQALYSRRTGYIYLIAGQAI